MLKQQIETKRGRAIGIDLGTTNSIMMMWNCGKLEIIKSREGDDYTPSVVGYFRNEIVVGRRAFINAASAPENTIFSINQLIGRGFCDEEVQRLIKKMKYRIVKPTDSSDDEVRVILGGKEYSPVDITAMILKKMKEDAELMTGTSITHAVITVPVACTVNQTEATRRAGLKAGFTNIKILDEHLAAAVAYATINNLSRDESFFIVVCRLDSGKFDVSVIMIVGGVFAELSYEWTLLLGGDDFDPKILDYVLDLVQMDYGIDGRTNPRFMMALKQECERAKIMLSSARTVDIVVFGLLRDNSNNIINFSIEISPDQFSPMIADDVKRSMRCVERAIAGAKLTKDEIDTILLVGGSTNIPYVQETLTKFFDAKKIFQGINPITCVSQGAAISAKSYYMPQNICPNCFHDNDIDAQVCVKCNNDLLWMDHPVKG